jgi:hypothetical protein
MSDLLGAADAALYKAKNAGRNCTVYCDKPLNGIAANSIGTRAWLGWRSDIRDGLTLPDGRQLSI